MATKNTAKRTTTRRRDRKNIDKGIAPIPSILCCDIILPCDINGILSGSIETILVFLYSSFNLFPIPINVPPVPTPDINADGLSGILSIISCAVVS